MTRSASRAARPEALTRRLGDRLLASPTARFLTADVSQVQVSRGYVSVLDGPGGMGGAINLVTRRPTAPFEGEVRAGVGLDGDGRAEQLHRLRPGRRRR